MELPRIWHGASPADDTLPIELQLLMFDRVRAMLVAYALPAEPPVYNLLWRYLTEDNHDLARAVDFAIATHAFDGATATALHRSHCCGETSDRSV